VARVDHHDPRRVAGGREVVDTVHDHQAMGKSGWPSTKKFCLSTLISAVRDSVTVKSTTMTPPCEAHDSRPGWPAVEREGRINVAPRGSASGFTGGAGELAGRGQV
jgi:hypothetical protein